MTTTQASQNSVLVVRTEQEFEKALSCKCPHFIFEGPKAMEIAKRFENAQATRSSVRGVGIGIGVLCLLAAPLTAGTSLLGMGIAAAGSIGTVILTEGVIIAIITAIVALGKAAIDAIKEYRIKKLENERLEFTLK